MAGVEEVDIVEEAVTMASVEQADTEGGAGSVREPDTQVDSLFAEKEDSHDIEFDFELREPERPVSAALPLALVLGLPFVFLPALAASLAAFLNATSAHFLRAASCLFLCC